jgi:hypothetical protein
MFSLFNRSKICNSICLYVDNYLDILIYYIVSPAYFLGYQKLNSA